MDDWMNSILIPAFLIETSLRVIKLSLKKRYRKDASIQKLYIYILISLLSLFVKISHSEHLHSRTKKKNPINNTVKHEGSSFSNIK